MVLCFELKTCSGIPEHMWLTCEAIISATITLCWKLFASFLVIRLLKDGLDDLANGKVDLRTHANTILRATFISIFLLYYKDILSFFDEFIDVFCISVDARSHVFLHGRIQEDIREAGTPGHFSFLKSFINGLLYMIPQILSAVTHEGAISIVQYFRAIGLFIAIAMGPFSALFSLLPGPFKHGWTTWSRTYATISCWAITLNLFKLLSTMSVKTATELNDAGAMKLFQGTVDTTMFSLVLLVAIFGTPIWTSIFIGHAITPNIGAGMRNVVSISKVTAQALKKAFKSNRGA